MPRFFLFTFVILLLCTGAYFLAQPQKTTIQATLAVSDALGNHAADTVYTRAFAPRPFLFPTDHASHNDYKTEWWYFTGNLVSRTGQRFGYQLTFFRSALAPETQSETKDSLLNKNAWKARQIFMAHFTVTDAEGKKFYCSERFSRVAQGLAGCELFAPNALRVSLDDWSAVSEVSKDIKKSSTSVFPIRLKAAQNGVSINLLLDSIKPVVLQGDRGLSAKSREAGNASYYYSLTRLQTQGSIVLPSGDTVQVEGTSWFDREWSTSALSAEQIGWDWFALHLDDGRDIMFYRLRKRDGTTDAMSKGVLVERDGTYRALSENEVVCAPEGTWKSPSGVVYPGSWEVRIPNKNIVIAILPILQNQELDVTVRYWEGAVKITGTQGDKTLSGYGYVEMTGYGDNGRKKSFELSEKTVY